MNKIRGLLALLLSVALLFGTLVTGGSGIGAFSVSNASPVVFRSVFRFGVFKPTKSAAATSAR